MAPPKPLTHAPKNPTRRSKEERDRLDKLESQRRQARADASAADAAAETAKRRAYYGIQRDPADTTGAYRGGLGGSLRYVRGGRGGFMGQRGEGQRPQPTEKRKKKPVAPVPSAPGAPAGFGGSGPRRASRRNQPTQDTSAAAGDRNPEMGIKADPDEDIAMLGIEPQDGAKEEHDHGYVSSDDEKILGQNIEYINLISDDEDDEAMPDASSAAESGRRRVAGFQPLRLLRKPHRDRNLPFSTEASSAMATSVRKEGRDKSRAEDEVTLGDTHASASKKGKSRSKDFEVLRSGRRWTGAYDDDDALAANRGVVIKEERVGEARSATAETNVIDDEEEPQGQATTADEDAEGTDAESKEAVAAKIRNRRKAAQAAKRPSFQTLEEQREYEKWLQDLEDVRYELGHIGVAKSKSKEPEANGNSIANGAEAVPDTKEDVVYLFQLPPIVPDLLEPSVKEEPRSPELTARIAPAASAPTINPNTSGPIKLEDDLDSSDQHTGVQIMPKFAAGKVGKFRVHDSGRATLTWGGISMEVTQGTNPHFLQSVVLANMSNPATRAANDGNDVDGPSAVGEATSFGQVRGKLVVTPDWSDVL